MGNASWDPNSGYEMPSRPSGPRSHGVPTLGAKVSRTPKSGAVANAELDPTGSHRKRVPRGGRTALSPVPTLGGYRVQGY